jgi:hypothetical protein
MTRRQSIARFIAGRAARIILAGSDPIDAPDNPASQVNDIILSNLVVREDASNGLVGYLYAVGTTAPVTFSITSDPDGIFAIVNGNELHKADAFGTGADYAITIKATETVGGTEYSEEFTVDVIPAEDAVPDDPIGDGGGSGDIEIPDDTDPDSDTDPYVQVPVEVVTEVALKVSGKNGGTSVFLKDWGLPEAGASYVLKYSADWTGMSAQGRYASVGFGFRNGNTFHMTGLRGNGAVMTTMLASRLYGDFRKAKQFTITNDGAAANGTRSGPNWQRLTIAEDGASYTLETSADGEEWDLEIEDAAPSPFTDATDATQFGPAAYFYEEDKGAFVISISEFVLEAALDFNDGDWTLSNATSADGVQLTDASAGAQGYALKAFETVSGTGYELSLFVVQDAVAPATRHPLLVVDLATDGQAWFATDSAALTILQGGSMGGWGVEDLGALLRYYFRFQAAAATVSVQIHPAYGQSAVGGNSTTGTVTFDDITMEPLIESGSVDFGTWTKFDGCGWTKNTLKDNNASGLSGAVKSFAVTNGVAYEVSWTITKDSDTTRRPRLDAEPHYMWFRTDTGVIADATGYSSTGVVDLGTSWRVWGRFTASGGSVSVVIYPSIGPTGSQYENALQGSVTVTEVTVTAV